MELDNNHGYARNRFKRAVVEIQYEFLTFQDAAQHDILESNLINMKTIAKLETEILDLKDNVLFVEKKSAADLQALRGELGTQFFFI
jgi:hypothetical protein